MKIGIVYWTSGGNTQELAERAKDIALEKGCEVYISEVDSLDRDIFFSSDILAFGSPAQGEENLADDIQSLMDSIDNELEGKKVFMFGSYGWGGGIYMDEWKNMMNEKSAIIVHDPVVCLEAPDEEAFENIDEAIISFLEV